MSEWGLEGASSDFANPGSSFPPRQPVWVSLAFDGISTFSCTTLRKRASRNWVQGYLQSRSLNNGGHEAPEHASVVASKSERREESVSLAIETADVVLALA